MIKVRRCNYRSIGWMLLLLHTSLFSTCEATVISPCRPIYGASGELINLVQEVMNWFPFRVEGMVKPPVVCKLRDFMMSTTEAESQQTTSDPTINTNPLSTTQSMTTSTPFMLTTDFVTPSDPLSTTQSMLTSADSMLTTDFMMSTSVAESQQTTSDSTINTNSSVKVFVTDTTADAIYVADLEDELIFTPIPSSRNPHYMTYDPLRRKIYWSDWVERQVFRAYLNGSDKSIVTTSDDNPVGIAIAETSMTLYIAYYTSNKIVSMSIEMGKPVPGNETDFISQDINKPRALVVDEGQGYLYWTMAKTVARTSLNRTGGLEVIYQETSLNTITGLSIDLSRNVRRIFFSDNKQNRTFYKDVNTPSSSAHELTQYLQNPYMETLRDIQYFNGVLYLLKTDNDGKGIGIGIMKNYDQDTSRSYSIQILPFEKPRLMLIAVVKP